MKPADLAKLKGKTIAGRQGPATADRYGKGASEVLDRREQRRRDQEAGLVPFAVKLHGDLVREVQALAEKRGVGLNELTGELIRKGLAAK